MTVTKNPESGSRRAPTSRSSDPTVIRMTVSRGGASRAVPTAVVSHQGAASVPSRDLQRVSTAPPAPAGWSGAAMAVHSVRQIARPVLVGLRVPDHSPIWIDLRSNIYVWDTALDLLPLDPEAVQVRTRAIEEADPDLEGRTQSLDQLLWLIGLNAFPGRATWLRAGDRYRLKVRPDFDMLPIGEDELKLVKGLARGLTTVEKLAARCKLPEAEAQRVINALSLMDVLRRVETADAAPMLPPMPQLLA